MRELFLGTRAVTDTSGAPRRYDYSILIDDEGGAPFFCENYGLRVAEQGSGEECRVPNITCSISRIDELSELVVKGGVTPVTLRDVVADWL